MSAVPKSLCSLAAAFLLALPSIAFTATRSSTFAVTAQVVASCSIRAPSALAASPAHDAIVLRCTQATVYAIALSPAHDAATAPSHASTIVATVLF